MEDLITKIDGKEIKISNPDKVLWPDAGITKLDYIRYLMEVAPYLLAYSRNRLLTTIRYPDGIDGKHFYQKNIPDYAPDWIQTFNWRDTTYILLNDRPTLAWVGNQASLELHVSFHFYHDEYHPTELVFDLDPMDLSDFDHVREVALKVRDVLQSLGLSSVVKTSGASGLQIYVPIYPSYTFEETRRVNRFIAEYLQERNPGLITLERLVKNRGKKLYLDYLQHWTGKTLPSPYSTRARPMATVSTPVTWEEVESGFHPTDFTIDSVPERIQQYGDLFQWITTDKTNQSLDEMMAFMNQHLS
ncbi:MAG: DNA polymerase domain-containing protein [Bacillaceae bacterium]|nr:DNA polymerase domain-containing protein [Bacillaceae bacterium]